MSAGEAFALAREARGLLEAVRQELEPADVGSVVVSGMLADQLAKQLGAGAEPGAVEVSGDSLPAGAEVLVRVIAGEPSAADESLVRAADRAGVPTVLVQLWPQAEWTRPFVLSPFVVECRAGEGFPLSEIAARIVDASQAGPAIASRVPETGAAVRSGILRSAVVRTAALGALGARRESARPLISLEQAHMLSRLRAARLGPAPAGLAPAVVGSAAVAVASGFAFRTLARRGRRVLPSPIADGIVAAAGTWLLAKLQESVEARLLSG